MMDVVNAGFPVGRICEWGPGGCLLSTEERGEAAVPLVLHVAPPGDENEGVKFDGQSVWLAISDGTTMWYEDPDFVRPLRAVPELASRLFSHASTSPSLRCDAASPDRWGWLTPAGLGSAD